MPDGLFSYFDTKCLVALRTSHRVLALFLGQTEYGAAMLAFAVNMCLSVAKFVFLQLEESADFVPDL